LRALDDLKIPDGHGKSILIGGILSNGGKIQGC